MQWVWDYSTAKGTQRMILLAIADNAADDGTHAYPSVAELVRKANASETAVHDAIKGLQALGELEVKRNGGPGRVRTNMYRVIMDRVRNPDPADPAPPGVQDPDPLGTDSGPGTVTEPSDEPSTPPEDAGTAGEPTAGSIVADWIDYCSARQITLTRQVIGRYAKAIKALLEQGFTEQTIKWALDRMLQRGFTNRPGLLDSFVVEVQQQRAGQPPNAPAARPGYQTAAEKREAAALRERTIAAMVDHLIEELGREPSMAETRLIRERAEKIYEDRVNKGTGSGYGGPNPVDAEWTEAGQGAREVTAREDDRGSAAA